MAGTPPPSVVAARPPTIDHEAGRSQAGGITVHMPVSIALAWLAICLCAFVIPYAVHRVLRRSPLALWLLNGVRPKEQGWGLLVGRRTSDAAV